MAQTIPSNTVKQLESIAHTLRPGDRAELDTLKKLEKELPDELIIFHSLQWSWKDGNEHHGREVDFIIINPKGNLLIVRRAVPAAIGVNDSLSILYAAAFAPPSIEWPDSMASLYRRAAGFSRSSIAVSVPQLSMSSTKAPAT